MPLPKTLKSNLSDGSMRHLLLRLLECDFAAFSAADGFRRDAHADIRRQ
jgi:hypothetical protein